MSDAALNEAVARAMGLNLWRSGGCLLDHDGLEWNILADDYSGVPAMEAWCSERGWRICWRTWRDGLHTVRIDGGPKTADSLPRALALAIVAAVEAGR